MIIKIHKSKSLSSTMRYVYQEQKQGELVASTCLRGDQKSATKEMQDAIDLRPGIKRPFMHATISVEENEQLTQRQWQELAHRYMKHMGYELCPYVAVKHHDTAHHHIHLVSSRISLDEKVVSDSLDYRRAELFARQMEQELGLRALSCSWEQERSAPSQQEYHQQHRLDKPSARCTIKEALKAVESTRGLDDWREGLARYGVEVRPRLSQDQTRVLGVSFAHEGVHIAGSKVDKSASWSRLKMTLNDDAERALIRWFKRSQDGPETLSEPRSATVVNAVSTRDVAQDSVKAPAQSERRTEPLTTLKSSRAPEPVSHELREDLVPKERRTSDKNSALVSPQTSPKAQGEQTLSQRSTPPQGLGTAEPKIVETKPSSVRKRLSAFEREQLELILKRADWSHGYKAWQESLGAQGMNAIPVVSASDRSQVRGLCFEYQGQLVPSVMLGEAYSFNGLQQRLGRYDSVKDVAAFTQLEVEGVGRVKVSLGAPKEASRAERRLCEQLRPISENPELKRFEIRDEKRPVFEAKAGDTYMSSSELSAFYQQRQQVWLRAEGLQGAGTLLGQDVMLKDGRHALVVDVQHRVVLVPYQETFEALRGQDVMLDRGALIELQAYQSTQLKPPHTQTNPPPQAEQNLFMKRQAREMSRQEATLDHDPKRVESYPIRPVDPELAQAAGRSHRDLRESRTEAKIDKTEATSTTSLIAQERPAHPAHIAQSLIPDESKPQRICERSNSLSHDRFLQTLGQGQEVYPVRRGDELVSIEELLAHRQSIQRSWTPLEKAPDQLSEMSVMPRPLETKEGRFAVLVTQEHRVYFASIPQGFEGALGRDLKPQELKQWAHAIEHEKALKPQPMPVLERDLVRPVLEHRTLRHFAQDGEREVVQARDPQTKALLETNALIEQQLAKGESWRALKSDHLPERATLMEKDIVTAQGRHSLAVTRAHEVILMKHHPSHDRLKGQDISFIANDQKQVRIVSAPEREQNKAVSLEHQAARQTQRANSTPQVEPAYVRRSTAVEPQSELPSLQQWKALVKANTRKDVNVVGSDKSVRGTLLNDDLYVREGRFVLLELTTKHIELVPYQPELEAYRHREVSITLRAGARLDIKDMTPKLDRGPDR